MADPVWWNLDMFLAEVISRHLRDYARHSSGLPGNMSAAEWRDKLASIAERLEAYQSRFEVDLADADKLTNDAKAAMHELADIFPALWD